MKNLKKKGFTIVELVIVIAVIAILATVLIPTFVNLTRKANISSDTVIAKEINTIIAAENAIDEFEGFEDVIEALYSNGFYLANLNTKTDGCFFIWDSETNQMLLVDAKDDFKVLFPETGYTTKGATWHLVCSDIELLTDIDLDDMKVNYAVSSSDSLNKIIAAGTEEPIFIDKNFEIKEGSAIAFENSDVKTTLILGDSSLSTKGTINGAPIYVSKSTLTIQGGTLNATGEFTNEYGKFACAIGYDGGTYLTVIDVKVIGITGINGTMNGINDGHVELVVEDSIFEVSSDGVILSTGNGTNSTAVINNCSVTAGKDAIFTSQGGTITINDGTYQGKQNVIAAYGSGTTIIVNSGTFVGQLSATEGGQIIINGGTFSVDPTVYLAKGCKATKNADGMWEVTSTSN